MDKVIQINELEIQKLEAVKHFEEENRLANAVRYPDLQSLLDGKALPITFPQGEDGDDDDLDLDEDLRSATVITDQSTEISENKKASPEMPVVMPPRRGERGTTQERKKNFGYAN